MMRSRTILSIMLVHGASVSGAAGATEDAHTSSGSLEPGWNLVAVPFHRAEVPEPWIEGDLGVWPASSQDTPAIRLDLTASATPQQPWLRQGGYWVYTNAPQAFEIQEVQRARAEPPSAAEQGWQFLATSSGSNLNRVVRWDPSTSAYVPVTGDDTNPGSGYFGYRDVDGSVSTVSNTAKSQAAGATSKSSTPSGQFEPPASVAVTHGPGLLARSALSETSEDLLAHVAYLVRGDGKRRADQVRYQRSEQAGKPGSFSEPQVWLLPNLGATVRDLALTARGAQVSIAWIVYGGEPSSGSEAGRDSKLVVVQSQDGGQSFGREAVVRANEDWKRGLDIAYDASLNHHLVWGEANKAYYLKNLEGTPVNVFDDEQYIPLREEAKYLVKEQPIGDKACVCIDCWCEETEVLGGADETAAIRSSHAYRFRRQVRQPSIHVGDDTVSIVVRQTRAWDPRPVAEPTWTGTHASPRYDDKVVQHGGHSIRKVVGWRKVWKTAYEPGDEALWDALGGQFQYRYAGAWQEGDKIMLARRPLTPQPGPEKAPEISGQQNTPKNRDLGAWTVASVASVGVGDGDNMPSYPKLAEAPWGLVLVYEDGVSANPNQSGHNAIHFQFSIDGGQSWAAQETLGTGYVPTVEVSEAGDIQVLFYEPDSAQKGTIVSRSRDDGQSPWGEPTRVNAHEAKPIHWKSHGDHSDGLEGGVSVAAYAGLFFAAWIEQADGQDRIVTARAARTSEAVGYSVELPERMTQGQNSQITVTAVNEYHMRVDTDDMLRVKTVSPSNHGGSATENEVGESESGFAVSMYQGQAAFWANPSNLQISGAAATVLLAPTSLAEGLTVLEGASGAPKPQFAATVDGNYEKAKWLRDQLWRDGPLSVDGTPTGYQVEYEPVEEGGDAGHRMTRSAENDGKAEDASFLAQYERVWAYTQGIALAQYAQVGTPEAAARAQALARTLCARAVRTFDAERQAFVIRGWPFSWNTLEDDWRDARLVTGATAWVVHGIGLFLVSEAFQSLSVKEQEAQRACYRESLAGLEAHRRVVVMEDGRRFNLMTAGWTAQGLVHARSPWKIKGPSGAPMATEGEAWDYYDVLDAIGYDDFNPDNLVQVARTEQDPTTGEKRTLLPRVLTEYEILLLKKTVRAENVVTEHNLDVLSVLNHALNHASALGLDDVAHLTAWRNDVRNGIFQVLWDQDHIRWKAELEGALSKNRSNIDKQIDISNAISTGDWGRVVTGGELRLRTEERPEATFDFIPNRNNTAIDNCSWLSLSVDYEDLTSERDIDALARCLEFTALAFGKDIAFQGKTYYGAHYFFDGFEDQYIDATNRQEESFHLEATAGLIMGLRAFAEHHPEHPKSDFFDQEALALWAGVQDFVIDHDFPYSSQRIIDLSTLLNSSTAIIWFIDTYKQFERHNETSSESAAAVPPFEGAFLPESQSFSPLGLSTTHDAAFVSKATTGEFGKSARVTASLHADGAVELFYENETGACHEVYRFSKSDRAVHLIESCETTGRYLDNPSAETQVAYIIRPAPEPSVSVPWPFSAAFASSDSPLAFEFPGLSAHPLVARDQTGSLHVLGASYSVTGLYAVQLNLLSLSRNAATGISTVLPMPIVVIPGLTPSAPFTFVDVAPTGPEFEKMSLFGADLIFWDDVAAQTNDGDHLGEWLHRSFVDPFDLHAYEFYVVRFRETEQPYREQMTVYRKKADLNDQGLQVEFYRTNDVPDGILDAKQPLLTEIGEFKYERTVDENPYIDPEWQYNRSQDRGGEIGAIYILIYEPGRGWILYACTKDLLGCLEILRKQTKVKDSEGIILPPNLGLTTTVDLDIYLNDIRGRYFSKYPEGRNKPIDKRQFAVAAYHRLIQFEVARKAELKSLYGWSDRRASRMNRTASWPEIIRDPATGNFVITSEYKLAFADEYEKEVVERLSRAQLEALYTGTHREFVRKMRAIHGIGTYRVEVDMFSGKMFEFIVTRRRHNGKYGGGGGGGGGYFGGLSDSIRDLFDSLSKRIPRPAKKVVEPSKPGEEEPIVVR